MGILDEIVGPLPSVPFLDDAVILRVGTRTYDAWETIDIQRSLDSLSGSFSLRVSDKWRGLEQAWPLKPGEQVRVNVGQDPIFNGYIEKLQADIGFGSRSLSISGREKTGDLIDSSVGFFVTDMKDVTVKEIAEKIGVFDTYGIKIVSNTKGDGEPFKTWKIKPGETMFDTLHRAARLRGFLLISNQDGDLVITERGKGGAESQAPSIGSPSAGFDFLSAAQSALSNTFVKAGTSLVQGQNVLRARSSLDNSERFQTYIVKGQHKGSDTFFGEESTNKITANSRDLGIKRTRVKVIIADGNVDKATAQKRANWEATIRAARGADVSVVVQGWRQSEGGPLWKPNELVQCEIPFVGVDNEMLIRAVRFSKTSKRGTLTELQLTRPDAYEPKPDIKEEKDPSKMPGWESDGLLSKIQGLSLP